MSLPARILIVDDTPTNVLVMQRTLEKAGYEICVANDGFKAEKIAASEPLDLILLDMMMPGRDGIEVCQTLKSCPATEKIPVIFVTAHTERNKIVNAFSAGGSDYITKPFRADELLARVDVHVKVRRAEQTLVEKNTQLQRLAGQLADVNAELAQQARLDPLTKLLNRRAWMESAELEVQRARREQRPYALLMIDVDFFKSYNDSLGHQAGDECLKAVASALRGAVRVIDLVGRYGGEEFVILAPETDQEGASRLGERVGRAIEEMNLAHPASSVAKKITVSVGVSIATGGTLHGAIEEADMSMYAAKRDGRNRIVVHQQPDQRNEKPPTDESQAYVEAINAGTDSFAVTVLILDNLIDRVKRCRECLVGEGYRVIEATDCAAATTKCRSERPDVIVASVTIEEIRNAKLLHAFKCQDCISDVPIILMGVSTDADIIHAGLQAGATEYITDPINTAALITRVRSMAWLRRKHKDLLESYLFRSDLARMLSLLQDYCHLTTLTTDLSHLLDLTVSTISDIASCKRVAILLPSANRRTLQVAGFLGMDEQLAQTISVPVGQGTVGRVFATAESVIVNTSTDSMPSTSHHDEALFSAKPLFVAPLGSADLPVGVVIVTDRLRAGPLEPHELEFLDLLAGISGAAIQSLISNQARDQARDSIIVALAKLAEHRDSDTGKHLERVMRYSLILAEQLRQAQGDATVIDDDFLGDLRRAVPLHDIGKVAVPDRILHKPTGLNEEEMAVMHTHTTVGAATIQSVISKTPGATFLEIAEQIARAHHEWYDGSGYPCGLAGDEIPLPARIVAVADVYDALTTVRVYKGAINHHDSRELIIGKSGTQFDPAIVDAFLTRERDFVELSELLKDKEKTNSNKSQPDKRTPQPLAAISLRS